MPKVLLIDEQQSSGERIQKLLRGTADLDVVTDPQAGFFQAAEEPYECVIVSTAFADFDPLQAVLADRGRSTARVFCRSS